MRVQGLRLREQVRNLRGIVLAAVCMSLLVQRFGVMLNLCGVGSGLQLFYSVCFGALTYLTLIAVLDRRLFAEFRTEILPVFLSGAGLRRSDNG